LGVTCHLSSAAQQRGVGNHTFYATGIATYSKNGSSLEIAQQIAAHESVERIVI
jgi:hypothetical protein